MRERLPNHTDRTRDHRFARSPRTISKVVEAIDAFSLNALDAIRADGFDETVAFLAVTRGREAICAVLSDALERPMADEAAEGAHAG